MSWSEYVERHLARRTQADLARLVEVDAGTVSRWRKSAQGVDAGVAIRFARAVGDDPLRALIEAGYLTLAEARARVTVTEPSQLTNDELLELVRARMASEGSGGDAERAASKNRAGASPAKDASRARVKEPPAPVTGGAQEGSGEATTEESAARIGRVRSGSGQVPSRPAHGATPARARGARGTRGGGKS